MSRFSTLLAGIALAVLISCSERDIDVDIVPEMPRLVVYGIIHPDSIVSVWISQSKSALDSSVVRPVTHATVTLTEDGQPVPPLTLHDPERGHYRATVAPREGAVYDLHVQAEGFASVRASTQIPYAIPIRSVDYQAVLTNETPQCIGLPSCADFYTLYQLDLTFADPGATRNFYEVTGELTYVYKYETGQNVFTTEPQLISSDPATGSFHDPNEIFTEGVRFADDLLGGETYTFRYALKSNHEQVTRLIAILRTLHHDNYLYKRSAEEQGSEELYFGEPVQIHQNIRGGYGIFSSYSQDTVAIELD